MFNRKPVLQKSSYNLLGFHGLSFLYLEIELSMCFMSILIVLIHDELQSWSHKLCKYLRSQSCIIIQTMIYVRSFQLTMHIAVKGFDVGFIIKTLKWNQMINYANQCQNQKAYINTNNIIKMSCIMIIFFFHRDGGQQFKKRSLNNNYYLEKLAIIRTISSIIFIIFSLIIYIE